MPTKNKNAQVNAKTPAADIFTPIAPAPVNADLDQAFDEVIDKPTPTEALLNAQHDAAIRAEIEADAAAHSGATGDNTPIDIESGDQVTTGFFMDLTKDDGFELIDAGTRAVVSCVAAEAVVSSNGNPMLNLRVKVERVKGAPDMSKAPKYKNRTVKDRLMFIPPNDVTGSRGTIWRAKLAFKAFEIEWDARAFRTQKEFMDWLIAKAELFIGAVAEVTIGIDDGTSGGTKAPKIDPETGEPYPPKNTIGQYFKYSPAVAAQDATEDLPF